MQKKDSIETQHIRKADIILMVICLLSALLSGIWFFFGQQNGTMLRISYDGSELYTLKLENNSGAGSLGTGNDEQYLLITYSDSGSLPEIIRMSVKPELPADTAYNLLCITDGAVRMEAADCRDQICVHHKPISGNRENIICLPHKLVAEITGDSQDDVMLDGMVK